MQKRLQQIRKEKGKTQAEVAEILGISYQAYAHYEKGRREPAPEQLIKLANFFGVSVDYLVGYDALTPEERAAGLRETKKISITPIEDDMLYVFREVGKQIDEEAQRSIITLMENMLKLK